MYMLDFCWKEDEKIVNSTLRVLMDVIAPLNMFAYFARTVYHNLDAWSMHTKLMFMIHYYDKTRVLVVRVTSHYI